MGVAPPMAGMDAPFTPPPRPDESAPAPASPYGDPRLPQARPDYAPPSPYGDPRIPTARPPQTQDRASAALEAVLAPPVTSVTSPPAMPDAGQMPGPALESVRLPEGSSSSSAPPLQVAEMPAPQQPGPDLSLAPYETQRNDTSMGVPPAMAGIEAPASIEERLASAALPPTGTEFFRGDGAAFVPLGETIARPMQEQAPPDLAGEFDASTPAAAPPPQMPTGGPGTFAPFANGWQDPSLADVPGMGGISTPAERMGAAFPQSAPPSALVQAAQDRATPPAAPIASPPAESSWAESILGAPRALADSIGLTTPTVSALPFGARTGLDAVNSQGAATATPLPYLPAQPAAPQPAAAAPAWPTEIGRNPFDTMRGVTTYLPPAERTYETPVTSPPAALPQQPVGQVQPPGTPAPAFSTPPTQVESMPVYSPPPAELAPTPPAAPAATFTPGADNMGAWSQGPMTLDHATQEQKDALGRMAGVRRPGSRWGAAAKGALFGGSFLGLPGAAVGGVIGGIFGGTGLQGLRQPPQAMALPQQPVVNVDGSIVGGNIWNGGIARSGDPFGGRGVSHGGGSYSYGGSYTGGDPRAGQPPGQPSGSYFGGSPTVGGMPGYASDYNN
jgi:hypothetical protein